MAYHDSGMNKKPMKKKMEKKPAKPMKKLMKKPMAKDSKVMTEKQIEKLKKDGHSAKHIAKMKKIMKEGKSMKQAHAMAFKMVGK